MKNWIKKTKRENNHTVSDIFKCLDNDFDGKIDKNDLKWILLNLLKYNREEITSVRLDRLYRILDTFKTGSID